MKRMEKPMRKTLYCTGLLLSLLLVAPVSAGPRSDAIASLGIGFTLPDRMADGVLDIDKAKGCVTVETYSGETVTAGLLVCRIEQPDQTLDYAVLVNAVAVSDAKGTPIPGPGRFARDRAFTTKDGLVCNDATLAFTVPDDTTAYQIETFTAETRNGQSMWVVTYVGERGASFAGDVALMEATVKMLP